MNTYSNDLRIRVIEDCDAGMSAAEVANKYRVSSRWIYNLKRLRRDTGSIAPKRKHRPGRKRKFPAEDIPKLEAYLREGATSHGWANDLWTIRRVSEVIKTKFGIELSIVTVWNILKKDLRWSSIKPVTVLRERDEDKIVNWREREFDEIRSRAQKRGAYLVFADEAGFMLQPTLRKTFAPRGSRPVTRVSDPHGRISTACAITVSPKRHRLRLFHRMLPDNQNFNGASIAAFLDHVRSVLRSPLTMIWDSIPIHSAQPVRDLLCRRRDVVLEMIPEYAPELNPADGVWAYVKYGRLANYAPHDLKTLRKKVRRELMRIRVDQQLLGSFIAKTKLSIEDC